MNELPETLHEQIKSLCSKGDALVEEKEFRKAFERFDQAYKLIPEPKQNWEVATWVLAALGDAAFLSGHFTSGQKALSFAMHCPGAIGNPFLHLRLGQCEFELGNTECAVDELARAYMGAGKGIFETEDAKYFSLVKTHLKPPASGVW